MLVALRSRVRRTVLATAAVAAAVTLAACGSTSPSGTPQAATPTAVPPLKIVTPTPAGPAPATTAPATSQAAQPTTTEGGYVVQAGDTLSAIATRLGVSQDALMKANGITDPAQLTVGQRLNIPAKTP